MTGYAAALLLTLAVEPPLYAAALALLRDGHPWPQRYAAGLLANATSHPLTWLVLWRALSPHVASFVAFAAVEAFAVAWEAALLRAYLGRDLAVLAGVACAVNAVSLGLGALLLH
jgi:hypothetical protein